jgi:hypothetical protein
MKPPNSTLQRVGCLEARSTLERLLAADFERWVVEKLIILDYPAGSLLSAPPPTKKPQLSPGP